MRSLESKKQASSWLTYGCPSPKIQSLKKTSRSNFYQYNNKSQKKAVKSAKTPTKKRTPKKEISTSTISFEQEVKIQKIEKQLIDDGVKIAQGRDLFQQLTLQSVHFFEEGQQMKNKFDELKGKYSQLKQESKDKTLQIQTIENNLSSIVHSNDEEHSQVLHEQVQKAQKHGEYLKLNLETLQKEIKKLELEGQIFSKNSTKTGIREELVLCQGKIEKESQHNKELKDKIQLLQKDKERIQNDIDILRVKLSKAKSEFHRLSSSYSEAEQIYHNRNVNQEEFKELKEKEKRKDEILQDLSTKYKSLIMKPSSLKDQNSSLLEKTKKLEHIKLKIKKSKKSLLLQKQDLVEKLQMSSPLQFSLQLTKKIDEKKIKAKTLEQEIKRENDELEQVRALVKDLQAQSDELHLMKEKMITEQTELRNEVQQTLQMIPYLSQHEEDAYTQILMKSRKLRSKINLFSQPPNEE